MDTIYLGNRKRHGELLRELDRAVSILKQIEGVQKIILFGSMVGGKIAITSDLDLLVVQETDKRWLLRAQKLMEIINPRVSMDILVYTPEEFIDMQQKSNRFIKNILNTGRVIYEK